MQKQMIPLISIFLLLFIASCAAAPSEPQVQPIRAQEVSSTQPDPLPVEQAQVVEEEAEPELVFEENVRELLTKGSAQTNYQFRYATVEDKRSTRKYFVKDNLIRVELFTPTIREKESYDVVYLNLAEQKAAAYCAQGSDSACPNKTKIIERPDFAEYYLELPHELAQRIDNGEQSGSITYDSQVATIIDAVVDEKFATITLSKFYGLPLKMALYDTQARDGAATGFVLSDVAFNSVSTEQVTPPNGW